jgi:hypothetical protein
LGIRSQLCFSLFVAFQACGLPWGTRPPRLRPCRRPTTPLNRSWRSCGPPPSRPTKGSRRARHRPGARWRAACAPLGVCLPTHAPCPPSWHQ